MNSMKLWLLKPRENLPEDDNPWNPWYDKAFGFVVRATDRAQARALANKAGGDETGPTSHSVYRHGGDAWLHPKYSTCEELIAEGPEGVVLRDFRSA